MLTETQTNAPRLHGTAFTRYLVAACCGAAAALLQWFSAPLLAGQWPYAAPLLAVILAAWYGGFGPALVAACLGSMPGLYWALFATPASASASERWLPPAEYFLAGFGIALLAALRDRRFERVAAESAAHERAELELRATVARLQETTQLAKQRQEQAVSDRRAMEQQLHTSDERTAIAQKAGQFCLFDWNIAAGSMFIGGDVERIFGVARDAWQGYESWMARVHPTDRAHTEASVIRSLEQRRPFDTEFRVLRPDGSLRWVLASGSPIYHEDMPRRMVGIFQDITERKTTAEALMRTEKLAAAGRLAASIAHEINNPLAAVTNLLFIIKDDPTLSSAGRQYLGLAEKELARAAQIAKQALGFYKEEAEAASVDIADILDDVLSFYGRHIPAHVTLEKHYPRKLEVHGLKGELQQVFSNLIANAIHVLHDGGTLQVEARRTHERGESGVLVIVRDNGPGIAAEHVEQLFEPFFTSGKHPGTGLGLWLVRQIVKKHDGVVSVESSTDPAHHGAAFFVFLPARQKKLPAGTSASPTETLASAQSQ